MFKNIIKIILTRVICVFHIIAYTYSDNRTKILIDSDIEEMNNRNGFDYHLSWFLLFYPPYRNLFYKRLGRRFRYLAYILKPYPLFIIDTENIGKNAYVLNHPYATVINCKSIGDNFTCCHLTTIGNKKHGFNDLVPTIGNNVSIGANVTILGDITIGDNVIIGAGSVVLHDIPSNSIVGGNPAKVIKTTNLK